MSIHHATATKAAAEGIALAQDENNGIAIATEDGQHAIWHTSAKVALAAALLARTLRAEYPAIAIGNAQDPDTGADAGLVGHVAEGEEAGATFGGWDDGVIPSIAEVLDAAIEAGHDPEAGAEDDSAPVVVVAPLYKQRYADGGHPEHCGDWLAYQLEGAFAIAGTSPTGKKTEAFDTDAFSSCLTDNGIELVGKWAALPTSGQPGWQGRYRMNGRQKLERQVASCGELVLHGATIEVPADALDVLRAKHPKAHVPAEEAEAG